MDELNAQTLDVSLHNLKAIGLYFKKGFKIVKRGEKYSMGYALSAAAV